MSRLNHFAYPAQVCNSSTSSSDVDSTLYVQEQLVEGDDSSWVVSAFENDLRMWHLNIEGVCTAQGHLNYQGLASQVVAFDGTILLLLSSYGLCPDLPDKLIGVTRNTGDVLFEIELHQNYMPAGVDLPLLTHPNGFILRDGEGLRYFAPDGVEDASMYYSLPADHGRVKSNASGTVYIPILDQGACPGCLSSIEYHTINGADGSMKPPDVQLQGEVFPMADGRVALFTSSAGGGQYLNQLTVLDADGGLRYTRQYDYVDDSWHATYSSLGPLVNGNFVLVQTLSSSTGSADQYVRVEILDEFGETLSSWSSEQLPSSGSTVYNAVNSYASTEDVVYASVCLTRDCRRDLVYKLALSGAGGEYPRVALTPPELEDVTYVALGDSFSSGEGVAYRADGTDAFSDDTDKDGVNECHRSSLAYPAVVDGWDLRINLARFVACSGAEADDVVSSGQWNEPAQVTALDPTVDVVTLTIGGNDVGFAEAIGTCVFLRNKACGEQLDRTESLIGSMNVVLENTYNQVKVAAPGARILVLGYPHIFPREPQGACGLLFSKKNLQRLWDLTTQMNLVIEESAAAVGVEFLSVDDAFLGHDVCGPSSYFIVDPENEEYNFHPNAPGQEIFAGIVLGALSD